MTALPPLPARHALARFGAVTAAYFLASLVGTAFVVPPEGLSVFWPAGGLFLGYLLVIDRHRWPAAAAAAFVGNLGGNMWFGHTAAVSAGFAAVNAVEPLLVAWLIERSRGGRLRLDRVADVFRLFLVPLAACAVTALVGAAVVTTGLGAPSFWGVWKVWWLADALGAILFAPLVMAWAAGGRCRPRAAVEVAATVGLLAVLVWAIFASDLRNQYPVLAMSYPVFPMALWITLRSDARGTSTAVVASALIATCGTLGGRGPISALTQSPADAVLATQGFVATVCLSSLALMAAIRQRRAVEDELRDQERLLRAILDSMGEAVIAADAGGRVVLTNAAFDRLHPGLPADRPPGEWPRALGVYLPDGATLCPADRLPIFRAARGESCDDVRLLVVNAAHPGGAHVSVTGRPVAGPGGPGGGVITIRDVTAAVRAEEARRESEELLARFFESPGSLRGVVELADGDIVHVRDNAEVAALFGRSPEEMAGRRASELGISAAAVREWTGHYRESARVGRPVKFEFAVPGAGRWLAATVAPLSARPGGAERFAYVAHDVTERKRAEAALAASEQRFKAIFHSQFQFVGLMAPDGTLLEANRTALAAAGVAEADVVGRPFWETGWWAHDPTQQERLKAAVRRAAGGERDRFEASHPTADGGLMWVDFSLTPFRDDAGAVVLLIPEGRDVTDRKRIEAELRANEELLRQFVAHAPAAIAMLDRDMRYLRVSDRWLADYHLGNQNVIGRSHYEVFPDIPQRWKDVHARVLAGAVEACENDAFPRADGGTEWLQWEAWPWREPSGAVGGVIFFTQVITPRKQVEAELRESEGRFRSAFDHAPIGMALVAPDGRWLRVNRSLCDLVGYPEPQLLATDFQTLTHPDDLNADLDLVRRVLAGAIPGYQMEKRYIHKRGHVVHALLSVSLVRDDAGGPLYFISQIKDITGRKAAEQALRDSEERFRVLFEQSSDAHLIFGEDEGIIDCNNAAVAMLRCADKRQVLALHPAALSPEFQPDGRRSLEKCVEMDGLARRHGHHRFDWLHRRFDGEVFPCEVTLTPVELRGRPALLVVWHDLTERQQAEAALQASEERYRSLVEDQTEVVSRFGPDGRFEFVNGVYCRTFGKTADELVGRTWQPVVYPADVPLVEAALATMCPGNTVAVVENRVYDAAGRVRWMEFVNRGFYDAAGALVAIQSVGRDVTDRKQAEERLRESEERLRLALEGASAGCWAWDAAVGDTRWDDQFHANYGFGPDQPRSLDGWIGSIHPDDRARVLDRVGQVRATPGDDRWEMEFRSVHPERGVRWHYGLGRCERGAAGGLVRVFGIDLDVTERKRAEERLRESRSLLALALRAAEAGVWHLDVAPRRFTPSERAVELHGLPPGAALDHEAALRCVHPDDRDRVAAALGRTLADGAPYRVEYRVAGGGPDGRWLASFADLQPGPEGPRLVGLVQDVTERKRAEERLRASLREKEVLLKEIHHRVKNNLQIVSTLLDLQSDYTADPGALEMFRESRGRVKSMALVHERLYRSADVARVDFAEYARQLADDLYHAYRVSDDVRLDLEVDAAPLPIDVAIPLGLLLNELMSNCFKHAFKGAAAGVLRVSLTAAGGANELVVADDGVGFPAGADFRNTASFGLQLVNTLVEQLRGTIELTAGRGTAFTVRFAAGTR